MKLHSRNRRMGERGSILIWVALFILVMLAFVALGIDGAKLMATRTQLQNAADAGALAGASAVNATTGVIDQAEAVPRAEAAAASNKAYIGGAQPVLDAVVTFPTAKQCRVEVTRSGPTAIVTHLAQVMGVTSLNATASATAEIVCPSCVLGLRPLGVGNLAPPFNYVAGQEYVLSVGLGSGNYEHLDFSQIVPPMNPPCSEGPCAGMSSAGGALLRCMIAHGLSCCLDTTVMIRVQTGVSVGNISKGVDALFDDYGDIKTEYPPSQTNAYAAYKADGGNDARVVVVPLVTWTPTGCTGNNCWAKVNGFASFFLKRRYSGKKYFGEFIQFEVPGEGSTNNSNSTVFTLKLVQ